MPIYEYFCSSCKEQFKAFDPMDLVREDCLLCESTGSVSKVLFMSQKRHSRPAKTGDLVKEYIKDSKEDLKAQVEELKKNR